MELRQSIIIERSAEVTWGILGERFADASRFASAIDCSSMDGPPKVGAARTCEVPGPRGGFTVSERLFHYDPSTRSLGYELERAGRLGLGRAANVLRITPVDATRCSVSAHATVSLRAWLLPLYLLVRLVMVIMGRRFFEELKHYAERGEPHPRKAESQRRARRSLQLTP